MNKDYFSNLRDALGATKLTFTEGKAKGMDVIIAHNNLFTNAYSSRSWYGYLSPRI